MHIIYASMPTKRENKTNEKETNLAHVYGKENFEK